MTASGEILREDRNDTFGNFINATLPKVLYEFAMSTALAGVNSNSLRIKLIAHAILDVVVYDEIKFFLSEAIMLRQKLINLIDISL